MRPKNPSKTYLDFEYAEKTLPIERRDGQVRLVEKHGDDWHMLRAAAEIGFRQLSPRQQEALRLGFGEGGVHALNDPAIIESLANRASGAIPASPREIQLEINLLKNSLRTDRSAWFANPAKAYRLGRLLRAQKQAPAAARKINQPVTSRKVEQAARR